MRKKAGKGKERKRGKGNKVRGERKSIGNHKGGVLGALPPPKEEIGDEDDGERGEKKVHRILRIDKRSMDTS